MPVNRKIGQKKRRWWQKLFTIPGIAVSAAFTAAVSWLVTQFLTDARSKIEAREPLAVSVNDNPARISAFSDVSMHGIIPASVQTTGSPGRGCEGTQRLVEAQ